MCCARASESLSDECTRKRLSSIASAHTKEPVGKPSESNSPVIASPGWRFVQRSRNIRREPTVRKVRNQRQCRTGNPTGPRLSPGGTADESRSIPETALCAPACRSSAGMIDHLCGGDFRGDTSRIWLHAGHMNIGSWHDNLSKILHPHMIETRRLPQLYIVRHIIIPFDIIFI